MKAPHKFCALTGFCDVCGVLRVEAEGDPESECYDDPTNVVTITKYIYMRRLRAELKKAREDAIT